MRVLRAYGYAFANRKNSINWMNIRDYLASENIPRILILHNLQNMLNYEISQSAILKGHSKMVFRSS